jgi:hypothetical protein
MPRLVQPPDELVRFWHEKYEQDLRVRSSSAAPNQYATRDCPTGAKEEALFSEILLNKTFHTYEKEALK